MPVTSAPSLAIGSVSQSPPQPISSRLKPASGAGPRESREANSGQPVAIYATDRVQAMGGLNLPFASHQDSRHGGGELAISSLGRRCRRSSVPCILLSAPLGMHGMSPNR